MPTAARADYWKSQGRRFCDFCKCWIADNKPSIEFHEGGKKHKENVGKRLREIHKSSAKQAKQNRKFEDDLKKMENAAMAAYLKDVENNTTDMTAERIIQEKLSKNAQQEIPEPKIPQSPSAAPETNPRYKSKEQRAFPTDTDPCDPSPQPRFPAAERPGVQAGSEKVQGKNKGGKGKVRNKKSQEEDQASNPLIPKVWYEALSPEGYTYYWHIHTNESAWEPPEEGFMSIAEQEEEVKEQAIQEELMKQIEEEQAEEKAKAAEEQRANTEREKLKELRRQRELQEQEEKESKEEPAVAYRRDYSVPEKPQPYGSWTTVQTIKQKPVDLQLPKQNSVPIVVPTLQNDSIAPRVFKEKTVTRIQMGDSDEEAAPSTFKKRRLGNKNVRRRMSDD